MRVLVLILICLIFFATGCEHESEPVEYPAVDRETVLPPDIEKRGPGTDPHPPILHSDEYEQPIPLPYPVNTSGAEDSAFILADGNTLYFFFTPDVRIPPEKQILDEVTGIYVTYRTDTGWTQPERVWLNHPGELSLDGAVFVRDNEMWFCSAREGYTGVNMFTAEFVDGKWTNWEYVGDQLMKEFQIGEVHLHGDDLYFHSDRPDGVGERDIWVTSRNDGTWSEPINIEAVNTKGIEGFPFVSTDGSELWFTRSYMGTPSIWRSFRQDREWGEPELIVSQFAGEPTLDDEGNLYFIHHYFEDGEMIEADIYLARRK